MNNDILIEDLNPTFLFTWKGTRKQDEDKYHNHDFIEIAFVLSGTGKYKIEGKVYKVTEGDLIIFNPGTKHQAILDEAAEVHTTEFFIGFTDIQLECFPYNNIPLPEEGNLLHTTGELRQKIFKICSSMEAENTVCKQGQIGRAHV